MGGSGKFTLPHLVSTGLSVSASACPMGQDDDYAAAELADRAAAFEPGSQVGQASLLKSPACATCLGCSMCRLVPSHRHQKVRSAVVQLSPKSDALEVDEAAYERCLRAVFGTRRKTLRNNLKAWFDEPEALDDCLERLQIDPNRRGETLTLVELVGLAKALEPRRPKAKRS